MSLPDISNLTDTQLFDLQTQIDEKLYGDLDSFQETIPTADFDPDAFLKALGAGLLTIGAILLVIYLINAFITYRIAKKAGHDKAWYAFVPYLNGLLRHDIAFGRNRRGFYIGYIAITALIGTTSFIEGFNSGILGSLSSVTTTREMLYQAPSVNVTSTSGALIFAIVIATYEIYTNFKLHRAFGRSHLWTLLGVLFAPARFIQEIIIAFDKKISYTKEQPHELAQKFDGNF